MNPETRLCWVPLSEKLVELKKECLQQGLEPPHWDRVESLAAPGYPDLSWAFQRTEGHIELKYLASWPAEERDPVNFPTINPHQRLWWRQRWEAGGNCYVLVRVEEEFLLFEGKWAAMNLGSSNRDSLYQHCSFRCTRRELTAVDVLAHARRK